MDHNAMVLKIPRRDSARKEKIEACHNLWCRILFIYCDTDTHGFTNITLGKGNPMI